MAWVGQARSGVCVHRASAPKITPCSGFPHLPQDFLSAFYCSKSPKKWGSCVCSSQGIQTGLQRGGHPALLFGKGRSAP